ncbi:MAG TPA: hypothetical protein PKZ01_04585 [Candidatus Hydrogenedentes bacterium]|nr:hypothetical protein [Candidatus Hydrogenedentota bacterium]
MLFFANFAISARYGSKFLHAEMQRTPSNAEKESARERDFGTAYWSGRKSRCGRESERRDDRKGSREDIDPSSAGTHLGLNMNFQELRIVDGLKQIVNHLE